MNNLILISFYFLLSQLLYQVKPLKDGKGVVPMTKNEHWSPSIGLIVVQVVLNLILPFKRC